MIINEFADIDKLPKLGRSGTYNAEVVGWALLGA